MAGRDPSRFDYLFEPIDGDLESVGTVDVRVTASRRPRFPLLLAAAVVLGAGLGAGLVSPGPADAVETPLTGPTTAPARPALTVSPVVKSPPPAPVAEPEPPPAPPPPEPPPVAPSAASVPSASRAPEPSTAPEPSKAPEPSRVPAPTPTVRAPLSVSPVPRPAFPNQKPVEGSDDGGGGLLGGLF
jgi:hypothetical protein